MNEDTIQKQKQIQEQQQAQQQDQVQLGQLQQQESPVQTAIQQAPQTMQVQQHVNAQQTAQMQQQAQRIEVDFGPPDDAQPVPTEMPKRSWKQQRRHNKVMKQVSEEIKEENRALFTVPTDELRAMNEQFKPTQRMDLIMPYLKTFKVDKYGKPKTKEDADTLEQNRAFMNNYYSTDKNAHNAALDKITRDFLAQKADPHCFDDPEETLKHYTELKHVLNMTMNFMDVKKMNPEYFANLDQQTKDAIEKQDRLFGDGGFNILSGVARMYGMEAESGKLEGGDDKDCADLFQQMKGNYKKACIKEKVNPMLDKLGAEIRKDYADADESGNAARYAGNQHSGMEYGFFAKTDEAWGKIKENAAQHPEAEKAYRELSQARDAFYELRLQQDILKATQRALKEEQGADGQPDSVTQLSLEAIGRQIKEFDEKVEQARGKAETLAATSYSLSKATATQRKKKA